MKKMMFSALACVAFAFSGFASNEVQDVNHLEIDKFQSIEHDDEIDPVYKVVCTVHVHLTDWFGNDYTIIESKTFWFVSEIEGNLKCDAFAGEMAKKHNVSGPQPKVISPR